MKNPYEFDSLIGSNMRRLREAAGMSVDDLAKALGCRPATVEAYEAATIPVRALILVSMADALGAKISDFVKDRVTS